MLSQQVGVSGPGQPRVRPALNISLAADSTAIHNIHSFISLVVARVLSTVST